MILLAGIPSEPPLAMLKERLSEFGAPVLVLNQREVAAAQICWTTSAGKLDGQLWVGDTAHALDEFVGSMRG